MGHLTCPRIPQQGRTVSDPAQPARGHTKTVSPTMASLKRFEIKYRRSRMEYKITPFSRGGFTVRAGYTHKGGELNLTGGPGVTMPAFIVYESCHCDTRRSIRRS